MASRFRILNNEHEHEEAENIEEHEARKVEVLRLGRIATAFSRQKYPLSEDGKKLLEEVRLATKLAEAGQKEACEKVILRLKDRLPTVENTHLELFADLDISKRESEKFLGWNLEDIRIIKGCPHDCLHCGVDAKQKMSYMPYPAILKINAEVRKNQEEAGKYTEEWSMKMKEYFDNNVDKLLRCFDAAVIIFRLDLNRKEENQMNMFSDERLRERWLAPGKAETKLTVDSFVRILNQARRFLDRGLKYDKLTNNPERMEEVRALAGMQKELEKIYSKCELSRFINLEGIGLPDNVSGDNFHAFNNEVMHYFDSDPLTYRDNAFLHEDGTPADYGDVVRETVPFRHVHVTTLGAYSGKNNEVQDKVGMRAAKKIVELAKVGKGVDLRISVHRFSVHARQDLKKYAADLSRFIDLVEPMKPKGVYFDKEPENGDPKAFADFKEIVLDPLLKRVEPNSYSAKFGSWSASSVSKRKGRAATNWGAAEGDKDERDISNCLPGYRVNIDGEVVLLPYDMHMTHNPLDEKPVGVKINVGVPEK